jgi:hypothetical protein
MQKMDRSTVKALELTAPGACRADFQALYGKVRSGQILGAFSERDREDIWDRVLSATVDCLVPSLFSFFEDLNYLKNVADGVKRLFPLSSDDTVSSAMEEAYSDANHRADQCVIQESESSCVLRPGNLADRVDLGRRQTWMFAMRDYPHMPAAPKRKKLSTKPIAGKADEIVLCDFAILAHRLGYKSDPISSLTERSADREIARSALLKARKPDRYQYDEAIFEDYVAQIARLFSEARAITVDQASAAVEIDYSDGPPKRCGIPYALDHERDRLSLFLDKLHNTGEEQCDEMSSFFIRRSVYFAYFGKPSRPTPRSPEEVSLLDTPISAPLGEDQVREEQERLASEQERLAREEQEKLARVERERLATGEQERLVREEQEQEQLAREEQERLAREEQARLAQEEQERQERLAGEEQERLAMEERERQVQLAKEEQERLEREELERQEQLAREEQERLARAEQERLTREQDKFARAEQERLAGMEQERLAREEQERLARGEQERLAREEQERLASEQERLAREEQERLARVERERLATEEEERLVREEQERQERAALEEQESLARGEQERLEREKQERLAREEQERLAREEQERQGRAARDEQERLIREERERLAREEQERLAREEQEKITKEEQERLAREEQERLAKEQERLAREEQERLAREKEERLAGEEQDRLATEEQERLAREEQDRLAREEQERLANKEQEGLAKEEQDRDEQGRVAREEQERVAREEQERLVENLAKQWKDRPKQKKPDKSQPDKGSKGPRSQNGVRRGLGAAKRRERPFTQFELKKVINGESSEANTRFAPPSQEFDFSLGAAGDQVEVDQASKLASDSREQNQAVERPVEEERPVREEQDRGTHEELERAASEEAETPATEGKERLVKNIAKQWEERIGRKKSEKTQDQRRPKAVGKGLRRGIGAAKRDRPLTQFALETLRDAEPQTMVEDERQITADQEVVGNLTHSTQPGTNSSVTNNSNSISASGKVPDHVTNSKEQIQAVEPQVRA